MHCKICFIVNCILSQVKTYAIRIVSSTCFKRMQASGSPLSVNDLWFWHFGDSVQTKGSYISPLQPASLSSPLCPPQRG